jgi:glucose/arabinose dehydrogenase
MRIRCLAIMLSFVGTSLLVGGEADEVSKATNKIVCRWTREAITIDGRGDEAAWKQAQLIHSFAVPWLSEAEQRSPRTKTEARLLWDRDYLYFLASMEDGDLFADIVTHDGKTWHNDVFELFFKPSGQHEGYYEFQVNAAGTVMDMFIPRRTKTLFDDFIDKGDFHLTTRVVLDGTLNQRTDRDGGWQVEGRIPWTDFRSAGGRPLSGETWSCALCRYDYDESFPGPDLSTSAPLTKMDYHQHEQYSELLFEGPDLDQRNVYGMDPFQAVTGSRVQGSPEPPLPYRVVRTMPQLQLSNPVYVEREPGSRRLFIIHQGPSSDVQYISRTDGDPGSDELDKLLETKELAYSLAFHPNYQANGHFFVASSGAPGADGYGKKVRVKRYTMSPGDKGTVVDGSSLEIISWGSDGHNGAALAFGHDGMLYITTGDGTSDSDTNLTGQGMDHLLAKLLRIDVDHTEPGETYSIPPDNPFVDLEGARPETWAYGFRNPWRIATDSRTGHIWVAQNGQDLWEQAYLVERGANYGWSVYEGSHPFYLNRERGPTPILKPTLEHPHLEARSLTGGIVYYGRRFPKLRGAYLYGDYSTGKIWAAKHDGSRLLWHREVADTTLQIVGFGADAEGELLIVDYQAGKEGGFYTFEANHGARKNNRFPQRLSRSGLFQSVRNHQLHPGAIPYDVNAPLWSDAAVKSRYVVLTSADDRIGFSPDGNWTFPQGTVLVKSFALDLEEGNPETRRWIETRFLLFEQGEWVGYSYRWNDQQTDGLLVDKQGADQVFQIQTAEGMREQTWRFPSRTECMTCHSRAANYVLGLKTRQLNRDFDYGGTVENQLLSFERLGVLQVDWSGQAGAILRGQLEQQELEKGLIATHVNQLGQATSQRTAKSSSLLAHQPGYYSRIADPYDDSNPLEDRVRAYLESNCAQCHVGAGGGNSQINLISSVDRAGMKVVGVKPLHDTFGIKDALLVAPGDPGRSMLLERIARRGKGQMPQLATSLVDEQAVKLLREWILQLPQEDEEPKAGVEE